MYDITHNALESFPWDGPAIGLLDLDAFFASVEQLDHPEWRGKPVIVGGSPEKRGVVSTASYEARRYGVHSAMPSAQARKLCPGAIWTSGNYARYSEMSAHVMELLVAETPYVEQVSIDEAFFDISPGRYSKEHPAAICRRIQSGVAALGISCSIGLGTNKTIAKIASEAEKPRGLTLVLPGTERDFLAPLPVRALSGIGPASEKRLAQLGIHTLGQLAEADSEMLERELGVHGPRLKLRASGLEQSLVAEEAAEDLPKSVSNERTFERDLSDKDEVLAAIKAISASVARRLRRKGLKGSTVTLKLKFDATHSHTAQTQLDFKLDDERHIAPVACELLDRLWNGKQGVRLVGVGVSGFDRQVSEQLVLGDSKGGGKDRSRLASATDLVRDRFGSSSLAYGSELKFKGRTSDTQPMGKADVQ